MSVKGRIIKGIGGFYYVAAPQGIVECHARGLFRKTGLTPTVGDVVTLEDKDGRGASIVGIDGRKNILGRPSVANIDQLVLVASAASPPPDLRLLDKLLVIAEKNDIKAVLCLNKSDLAEEAEIKKYVDIYEKAGYTALVTCAQSGIDREMFLTLLAGKTTAFAGLSGVGKSSLLSLIIQKELKVGGVSKIERGKHTTRHVELIAVNGAFVLDTPGFSQIEIEGVSADELKALFPEFSDYEGLCRFRGCSHTAEPDCAVIRAVKSGGIAQSRHENYVEIYHKLKAVKEWEK